MVQLFIDISLFIVCSMTFHSSFGLQVLIPEDKIPEVERPEVERPEVI